MRHDVNGVSSVSAVDGCQLVKDFSKALKLVKKQMAKRTDLAPRSGLEARCFWVFILEGRVNG